MKSSKVVIALAALSVLSGCATTERMVHDPRFAPAAPSASAPPQQVDGSIFRAGHDMALFEDMRARRVGDIITIQLSESTNASKSASTATKKENTLDMASGTLLGRTPSLGGADPLSNSLATNRDFAGQGSSSQSNSLSGSISVTVVQVMPNGNLVVQGEKVMNLNEGDEYIRIRGMVRPVDISSDNTVSSTKVANAEIIYSGNGAVADSNRMGWLARFFQSALFPF